MSDLPQGWASARLSELSAAITKGTTPKTLGFQYGDTGVRFVKAESLADGAIKHSMCAYIEDAAHAALKRSQLAVGDVLFTIAGTLGRVATVAAADLPANTNQAVAIIRLADLSLAPYVARYAASTSMSLVESGGRGTGLQNLNLQQLGDFEVAFPPLPEQRRIVAKIDSLTGKSRRAREHLDHIPRLVEKYKQAVLAAAFRGDLTREWRVERQLSATWEVTSPADHFEWSSGKNLPSKKQLNGTVPVIGGNGIGGYHNEALIDFPTLVVGRVGAQCGNVHFSSGPAWITDNAIYARSVSDRVDLSFAVIFFRNADLNQLAGGSGQPYVNQSTLNALSLDLPTIGEQREIVRRVEQMMNWIDRLAFEATSARRLIDRLDQAVLAKAFRGELVPQDLDDEPASVLLDRINAERPQTSKTGRGRRKVAAS